MGQTLSSAANWTSAKEGATGKLEYTEVNQTILNDIIKFVETFPGANAEEGKIFFKQPLTWPTSLTPNDVGSLTDEQSKDGQPLVSMKGSKGKGGAYHISVSTLEKCQQILSFTGDKKIGEVRACLEGKYFPHGVVITY